MKKLLLFSLILTSWVGWGQIQSNGTGGGDWANTATWNGGVVPLNSDAVTILAGDVVYTGTSLTRDNTTTVNGIFQINTGGWAGGTTNFTYGANGTLIFNNSGFYGVNSGTYWPSSNGPINVTVNSGSGINMGFTRTITGVFQTAAGVKGLALTFDGTCQINVGGYFTTTPTYGSSSTLIYNTGGSYGVYNEWTGGGNDTPGVGSGAPQNVIVKNNTVVTLPGSGKRGVAGNLTVEDTSSFILGGDNFYIAGNWNFASGSTFTHNAKIVNFSGNSGLDQTITHGGSGEIFSKIILRNPNGSVKLLDNININGSGTAEVIAIFNSTKIIDLNGYEMRFTGGSNTSTTNGQIKVSANNCLITGIAGSTVTFYKYKNIINNSGTGSLIFDENVQVILNSGFDPGSALTTIKGTLQIQDNGFVGNYPVIYTSNSTLKYYTTGAYNSGFEWKSNSISLTAGVPQNVEVHNGTILNLSSETHHALGNLSIYNNVLGTAVLNNSTEDLHVVGNLLNNRTINLNSTSGDLYVGGNWSNSGAFTHNSRAVFLNGSSTQNIESTSSNPQPFEYLIIDNNLNSDNFQNAIIVNKELTLGNGYSLTVKASDYLKVNDKIINNGTISVEDDGSLIQTHTGNDANTGTGTYKIYRTTRTYKEYDYNYWSSPVVGETLEDALVTNSMYATSTVPTPVAGGSYSSRIYELVPFNYNDTNDNVWDDNLDEWQSVTPSTVMPRGKGYIAHGAGADFPFNTSYYSGTYTQYVYFEGTNVNNGEFTVTLTHDSDTNGTDADNNGTTASDNLIGNPYPSALNAYAFYNANSSKIASSAYFWTHDNALGSVSGSPWVYSFNNSDYATLNMASLITSAANSSTPISYIASGQGFIVSLLDTVPNTSTAIPTNTPITFNNSMRESGNNDHFLRTYDDSNGVFWLNLTDNTGLYRQVAVGFHNGAQDSYETYDSPRMPLVDEPNFYTLANGSQEKLAIQGLATFNNEKQIPLGITTTYENTYVISLDHTQGIFSQTQKIYLEDTQEEIIHNLGEGAYTFTQTAGTDINDRFILRFTNTQLGHEEAVLEDLKLYPNPTKGLLNIAYSGSEPLQVTLYNQVGHMIGTYEGVQVLDLSQLAQGMYFAKIANSQGSVTRKIVLE